MIGKDKTVMFKNSRKCLLSVYVECINIQIAVMLDTI